FAGTLASPLSYMTWLKFSHIALAEVVLHAVVFALSWWIHRIRNVNQSVYERQASAIEEKLHHACWMASLSIAERSSTTAIADQFRAASEELLDTLRAHREEITKLAEFREHEVADLQTFSGDLKQGTAELLHVVQQTNASLNLVSTLGSTLDVR